MKQESCRIHDILGDVESQFESWRRSRRRGARIPAALWDAAVKAARDCGVSKVATALRLDYYKLKRRLEEAPELAPVGAGRFVEIPPWPSSPVSECVFELEDAEGTRLRVTLQGASPAELEPLARTLWSLAQ
jgi:hypothetical protein